MPARARTGELSLRGCPVARRQRRATGGVSATPPYAGERTPLLLSRRKTTRIAMRGPSHEVSAPARSFANSKERPWLTRAARRDIRRAHAVASELHLHSFAVHGVVWTLHHGPMLGSLKKNKLNEPGSRETAEPKSQRSQRSAQRAVKHYDYLRRAQNFYARVLIRRWARSARTSAATDDAMDSAPSPPPTTTPPPPPPPTREQPSESEPHEGTASGASKRRAPHAATTTATPSSPPHRDKRGHVLPGSPPPSVPPSPPSSSPSPPPQGSSPVASSRLLRDYGVVAYEEDEYFDCPGCGTSINMYSGWYFCRDCGCNVDDYMVRD